MLNEQLLRHMVRRELMGSYTALGGKGKKPTYRKCAFRGVDKDGFEVCKKYCPLIPYTSPKYRDNPWQQFLREYAQVHNMKRPEILRLSGIKGEYTRWLDKEIKSIVEPLPEGSFDIQMGPNIEPYIVETIPEGDFNIQMGPNIEPYIVEPLKKLKLKPKSKKKPNPITGSLRQLSGPEPIKIVGTTQLGDEWINFLKLYSDINDITITQASLTPGIRKIFEKWMQNGRI
jgi:ribosomal protein L37E